MSSLSMISTFYDDDSDSGSDTQSQKLTPKVTHLNPSKLPLPEEALSSIEDPFDVSNDPLKHQGRIRSFKHEQGNWATYVCIPFEKLLQDEFYEHVIEIASECENICKSGRYVLKILVLQLICNLVVRRFIDNPFKQPP